MTKKDTNLDDIATALETVATDIRNSISDLATRMDVWFDRLDYTASKDATKQDETGSNIYEARSKLNNNDSSAKKAHVHKE